MVQLRQISFGTKNPLESLEIWILNLEFGWEKNQRNSKKLEAPCGRIHRNFWWIFQWPKKQVANAMKAYVGSLFTHKPE